MAVLRNVPKTFSFEEQRIEINEIAQDLYDLNVASSGIALTDFSVVKPNPTASGSGDVTYDSSNGQFTYTPPELNFLTDLGDAIVDGDFTTGGLMKTDGAGNYSVIHDHSTEWDEAHDWGNHANAGYLTALPAHSHSLVDLSDTSLTGGDAPSDGEALVWDQANTTWKAGTISVSSGWQGNVQNSTTANGPGAISFDANTNTLIFQPVDTDIILSDINNFANVTITTATITDGDLLTWDQAAYKFLNKQPVKSDWTATGTIAEILNKPTLVENINDLGDVDTTGIVGGKILKSTASGTWVIADDDTGSSISTLNDIGDVNVGTTITDGHVLKWDLATTKWIAGPDLTSSGGSGIALTDISVVKPNPNASGSGDVTYNSTSGAFTYTPPSIPAAQVKSDWDSSTGLSEILNKPTIVENLNDLGDVDTTGAANGKILKHNGTSWIVGTDNDSGGGGGSTSPGGSNTQVQFNDTGSFAGDNGLTYTRQGSNTSGKPLLTVGTVTDGDAYLDVIAGRQTATGEDKKIQLRSTDTYAYLYASCDSDFHIEHNRDPAYRTSGAKIRIGAVGDHNAIFELSGESILNHAGNEKIKTTTDGVKITGGIQDKDSQLGTNGQVLTSTGTQLDWVDASTLSISSPIPAFQSNWRIPL